MDRTSLKVIEITALAIIVDGNSALAGLDVQVGAAMIVDVDLGGRTLAMDVVGVVTAVIRH